MRFIGGFEAGITLRVRHRDAADAADILTFFQRGDSTSPGTVWETIFHMALNERVVAESRINTGAGTVHQLRVWYNLIQ